MRAVLSRWMWLVPLAVMLAGPAALAKNKELRCKEGCVEMAKTCTELCKQQVKKNKAPQTAQYCAPKCNEIKLECDKECEDASIKHKPKR